MLLILLTSFLSACSASEELNQDLIEFDEYLSYNYEIASFNNTSTQDLVHGVYDYSLEFHALYETARNQGFISRDLSAQEELSYNNFFTKLETLERHSDEIFNLDSTELKSLFEANSIEVEAIDIFAFNAIKNLFDTLKDEQINIKKQDFIEIILMRDLTDIESSSIAYLYDLHNEVYNEFYEDLIFVDDVEEYILSIENSLGKSLSVSEIESIQTAHSLISLIK